MKKVLTSEFKTKRVTANRLDKILYKPFKVLDHGFVRVIDYMGDDSSIVQAARVSYGKGTKKLNQDKNLINYLLSHRHTTPFEMNEIKFHIKLPILSLVNGLDIELQMLTNTLLDIQYLTMNFIFQKLMMSNLNQNKIIKGELE